MQIDTSKIDFKIIKRTDYRKKKASVTFDLRLSVKCHRQFSRRDAREGRDVWAIASRTLEVLPSAYLRPYLRPYSTSNGFSSYSLPTKYRSMYAKRIYMKASGPYIYIIYRISTGYGFSYVVVASTAPVSSAGPAPSASSRPMRSPRRGAAARATLVRV